MFRDVMIFHNGIQLKFDKTPAVETLTYDSFEIYSGSGDGTQVTDAFFQIDVGRHYNSLTLQLTLYFDFDLQTDTKYRFQVVDGSITDVGGQSLGTYSITFSVGEIEEEVDDSHIVLDPPPPDTYPDVDAELDPVEIVDYSIRRDVFSSVQVTPSEDDDSFRVLATTPVDNDAFLPSDYNFGRINIWFSKRPDESFINETVFRVQRKKIGVGLRWEDVRNTRFELHPDMPLVTVLLPSLDNSSVYGEAEHRYFEKGYRYRLRVSGTLAAETTT